jgi:hypothetical protein
LLRALQYQFPFRADLVKNTAPSAAVPPPLDLVLRGSDHQNFVDIHLIAHRSLLTRPAMLGKDLNGSKVMSALDQLLPAYFMGVMAHPARTNAMLKDAALAEEVDVSLAAVNGETNTAVDNVHPSVQALLEVCGPRLPPRVADFLCSYVMPASELAPERIDTVVFDRVNKSSAPRQRTATEPGE